MKTLAVLTSIAFVGLIGCTDNQPVDRTGQAPSPESTPSEERTTQTAPSSETAPSPGTSAAPGLAEMDDADRTLAKQVEDALRQNSALASAAQNIQVQANDGEVTLSGSVSNEQEKADIESAAEQVTGVSRVDNQIEVASASR